MATEIELLRAWRDGDADAGDALFQRHFASVERFFRNKVPGPEVEDLVQCTFEACFEHALQYGGNARFVAWLLAVARSQLYRWLRRREPTRSAAELERSSLHELGVSPSGFALARERQKLLLDALARMPLELQTVLELHYWEGLSGAEIAEVVGIDHGTVRSRLHRARARLRGELAGLGSAYDDVDTLDRDARAIADLLT